MRLDISITNLETHVFGLKSKPLQPATQRKKAIDVFSKSMVIQEKIDGTKLTLIRTDKDSDNYENNWIVSYKGMVLQAWEFSQLNLQEVKKYSIGISQYALVFDHLKKINHKIRQIPKETEFSVEFSQNKETLTRTYDTTGEMFLRAFSKVQYFVNNQQVISVPSTIESDIYAIKFMAKLLEIQSFPIWFEGRMDNEFEARMNMSQNLKKNFEFNINWNDSIQICRSLIESVKKSESVLGGKPEGAVLKLSDGRFFKIVQDDQYDKDTRNEKKSQYKAEYYTENNYFKQIRKFIRENSFGDFRKFICSFRSPNVVIHHPKKNHFQILDDIHETAKLLELKSYLQNIKSVGMIPISGKPIQSGHWNLINIASEENDIVVIFLSVKDRKRKGQIGISGKKSVLIWKKYYESELPKNVIVHLVENPIRELFYELKWVNQIISQDGVNPFNVNLYSDENDIHKNFPYFKLDRYAEYLNSKGYIFKNGIQRSKTCNISGTRMRELIEVGNIDMFCRYLPPIDCEKRIQIYKILKEENNE